MITTGPAWTPEADARLGELWETGLPSKAIGRAMGRTKSAILGRVHRLHLPPRANPIKGGAGAAKRGYSHAGAGEVIQALLATMAAIAPPEPPPPPAGNVEADDEVSRRAPRHRLVVWAPENGPPRECQWPIGHPRRAGFRFCGAPAHPDRPYCLNHCRIAFLGFGHPRPEPLRIWIRGQRI